MPETKTTNPSNDYISKISPSNPLLPLPPSSSSSLPPLDTPAFKSILPSKNRIHEIEADAESKSSRSIPDLDQNKKHGAWKRKRGHSISSPVAVARILSISESSSSHSKGERSKSCTVGQEQELKALFSTTPLVTRCHALSRRCFAPQVVPPRKNQDAYLLFQHEESRSMVLCCMDGHGNSGELCSFYIKNRLEEELTGHPSFVTNLQLALKETISKIEIDMIEEKNIDTDMSGSTLIVAVIRDTKLTVANIGDSRLVCGHRDTATGEVRVERISVDHKPEIEAEANRIRAHGGRIAAIKYPEGGVGPLRVFLRDAPTPGLAMSRSVGDRIAHRAGVTSEPEFFERELKDLSDIVIIIATDGLWQYMDDLACVVLCSKCTEPSAAVKSLIAASNEEWLSKDNYIDDTTVCVAFLSHNKETNSFKAGAEFSHCSG